MPARVKCRQRRVWGGSRGRQADACEDAGGALAILVVLIARVGAGGGEGEDCHFLAEVFADGAFSLVYDAFVFVAEVCSPRLEQRFVCEGDDASADGKRTHVEVCVPRYERSSGVGGDVAARVKNRVCVAQLPVSDTAGVGVCFLGVEEVFASQDEAAASVVSVLLDVNLCFADVCCVNGDVIGGHVLALENVSSAPVVEAHLACCDAGVQG